MPPAKKAAKKKTVQKKTVQTHVQAAERQPGDVVGTVDVPLSTSGEHNGRTRQLTVRQPTPDQMAWAEGAFYRVTLAMEAIEAGEDFDQRDRGRVYTEIERLTGVFLSPWEADWSREAFASGEVMMADMWSAMADAFEQSGGESMPVGDDADIVIE